MAGRGFYFNAQEFNGLEGPIMADQEEFEKMREFSRVPVKIQVKLMVDGEVA